MFLSDEAWCHLSGYMNAQSSRCWLSENAHRFIETSLHPQKTDVWAALSGKRTFFFFLWRSSGKWKILFIYEPVRRELNRKRKTSCVVLPRQFNERSILLAELPNILLRYSKIEWLIANFFQRDHRISHQRVFSCGVTWRIRSLPTTQNFE